MKEERYKKVRYAFNNRKFSFFFFFGVTNIFLAFFGRYLTVAKSCDQTLIQFPQVDTDQAASGKKRRARTGREATCLEFSSGHWLLSSLPARRS